MFKVGDMVLGTKEIAWFSLYVQKIVAVFDGYVVLDTGTECKNEYLRHATECEIKQGKKS